MTPVGWQLLSVSGALLVLLVATAYLLFRRLCIANEVNSNIQTAYVELLAEKDASQEELLQITKEAVRFKRLAETHMRCTGDFETERNDAWRLYEKASSMGGNAQAWLMRELNRSHIELNKYRVSEGKTEKKVPEELQALIGSYADEHMSAGENV